MITTLCASALLLAPLSRDDMGKIAFVSERDGNSEIYSMNIDGSDVKRLTNDPAKDISPCWSPDGRYLVFASNRGGKWDIWKISASGGDATNMTHEQERSDGSPMWSRSDPFIGYISNRRFYTVRDTGDFIFERAERLLAADADPSMSPLGLRIAMRDVNGHLAIMEGSEYNVVVPMKYGQDGTPAQIYHPSWSSDGAEIIFDSGGQAPKIYTVEISDGTCDPVLIDGNGYDPIFAGNDGSVVFTSAKGEGAGSDIYIAPLDGVAAGGYPKPTNLTHNPGNDSMPAYWEPAS